MFDNIQAGKGTFGKLYTDDSLFSTYKQAGTNLSTATAKFNDVIQVSAKCLAIHSSTII